jgi:hypothetical protein
MRTTYRAGRVRALFFLVVGAAFAASSGRALTGLGMRWELVFFCLLGACAMGAGVCILLTRVVVDGWGLDRRAPFEGSFRVSWDEVESWWVRREGTDDDLLPLAHFRLHGRRENAVVHAADVARPGFDAFLEDVRAHVGDRETADADAAADWAGA